MRRILFLVAAGIVACVAALAVAAPSAATSQKVYPWFNAQVSLVATGHNVQMSGRVWNEGLIAHTGNVTLSLTRDDGSSVFVPVTMKIALKPDAFWSCGFVAVLPRGTYTATLGLAHVREVSDPVGSLYGLMEASATVVVK